MNKGLYCDRWRTRYPEEFAELAKFCNDNGVTDLYIHNPRIESGTKTTMLIKWAKIGFDPITYLLKELNDTRVHIWVSTFLIGRSAYKDIAYPTTSSSAQITKRGVVYLDPDNANVKTYIKGTISKLLNDYPDIYGIHLERFRIDNKNVTPLLEEIRTLTSGKWLTASVRPSDIDWKAWVEDEILDEAIPMLLVNYDSGFNAKLSKINDVKTVMLPAYKPFDVCVIANISKLIGKNINLYSWNTANKRLLEECYASIK